MRLTLSRGLDRSRQSINPRYLVAAVAATLLAGLAAGVNPLLVVAALVGLTVMTVMLVNVTVGLMVVLFVGFAESLPPIPGAPSLAKIVGLFLVVGWLGVIAFGRPGDRASLDFVGHNLLLTVALSLFLAWVFVSQLWAEDIAVARTTFLRYALNFIIFPIAYVAIRTPRHVVALCAVFVTGCLFVVLAGLRSGIGPDGRLSGGQNGLNPNELGALLAVGAVLGMTLAFYRGIGGGSRFLALCAVAACVGFLFMTGSRGALVGLAASIVASPFLLGPGRRLMAAVLVTGGAMAVAVWALAVAPQGTLDRFSASSGGSGRVDLWTIALRMFDAHPLAGVGAGNYPVSAIHYLLRPGVITRPEYIVDQPKVTHNIYLQVLAEMGLVGLILFLACLAICFAIGLRAAWLFTRQGDRDAEILTRGLLIALTGFFVAEFFSSALYSKQLYVLLAATPPLLAIAVRRQRSESSL